MERIIQFQLKSTFQNLIYVPRGNKKLNFQIQKFQNHTFHVKHIQSNFNFKTFLVDHLKTNINHFKSETFHVEHIIQTKENEKILSNFKIVPRGTIN